MTKGLTQNKQFRNALLTSFFKTASSTSLYKIQRRLEDLKLSKRASGFIRDYLRFVERHRSKSDENVVKLVKKFIRVYHQKVKKYHPQEN